MKNQSRRDFALRIASNPPQVAPARRSSARHPWFFTAVCLLATSVSSLVAQTNPNFPPANVQLQIVNDTGIPDDELYFRVVGDLTNGNSHAMTPMSVFTAIGESNPANATAVPLSTLATNSSAPLFSLVSQASGNTNTVYTVQVDSVASGQIVFQSGGTPFVFTNSATPSAAPTNTANYRFGYAEFTIFSTNGGNNAIDVTYVNAFGYPMTLEWFTDTSATNLVNSGSVHLSTRDLVQKFADISLDQAVYGYNSTNVFSGWNYTGPGSYADFARIIGPESMFPASTPSVFPYPSFSRYLDYLADNNIIFHHNVNSLQGDQYYVGYDVSLARTDTGWEITMQYNSATASPEALDYFSSLPGATPYTNTITVPIPLEGASQWIANSAASSPYKVNGSSTPVNGTLEKWVMGDVMTALNTGFWGGSSTNSVNWYLQNSVVPVPGPFGLAGDTNAGFYNPYSSIIYSYTDFYGFTYGERFTPNVLFTPGPEQVVRLTLLPDGRLNSPEVSTSNISSTAITLNWPTVPGATGYVVTTLRPQGIPPVTLPAGTTNYAATNLTSGWPYTFAVQATGTNATSQPLLSQYRSVSAITSGGVNTVVPAGDFTAIQLGPAANDPYGQIDSIVINGSSYALTNGQFLSNNLPPIITANVGHNAYPIAMYAKGTSPAYTNLGYTNLVYFDWLEFDIVTADNTNASLVNALSHGLSAIPSVNIITPGTGSNQFLAGMGPPSPVKVSPTMYVSAPFRPSQAALPGGQNNYAVWISQFYNASPANFPDSDSDEDGSSNLLEYFQARNPVTPDYAGSQSVAFAPNTNAATLASNFGALTFSYRMTTAPNELVYTPLYSTNLVAGTTWTDLSPSFVTNAPGGTNYSVPTYQINPVTNSNVFFQFDVTLP